MSFKIKSRRQKLPDSEVTVADRWQHPKTIESRARPGSMAPLACQRFGLLALTRMPCSLGARCSCWSVLVNSFSPSRVLDAGLASPCQGDGPDGIPLVARLLHVAACVVVRARSSIESHLSVDHAADRWFLLQYDDDRLQ